VSIRLHNFPVHFRTAIAKSIDLVQLGDADEVFVAGFFDVDLGVQNLLAVVGGFGERAAAGIADFRSADEAKAAFFADSVAGGRSRCCSPWPAY
jgi:hypothetical protein